MQIKDRKRTLRNIARLRMAERQGAGQEVSEVREDLEEALGGAVSRNFAAQLLGVSHTALNRWIEAGEVAHVIGESGRREVPLPDLLELHEKVEEERASGRRRLHVLEPAMDGPRQVAASTDRDPTAELRDLAYHRVLAPRLGQANIEEAERRLVRWARDRRLDPSHAEAWRELFELPISEIREAITADDERGRALRRNSPLVGPISEPEREQILAVIREVSGG